MIPARFRLHRTRPATPSLFEVISRMTSFIDVFAETRDGAARMHEVLDLEEQSSSEGTPRVKEREILELEFLLSMTATASASPSARVAVVLDVGTIL